MRKPSNTSNWLLSKVGLMDISRWEHCITISSFLKLVSFFVLLKSNCVILKIFGREYWYSSLASLKACHPNVTSQTMSLTPTVLLFIADGLGVRRDYKMAIKFFNLASQTGKGCY